MNRALLCIGLFAAASSFGDDRVLRVCADPNNLPFSNSRGEGFENALAELLGNELHAKVEYTWWAQRRGFVRNTLKAHLCDAWMGMPQGSERVLTTRPVYRSSYVFVSKKGRADGLASFDDPRLRKLKVGVMLIGDDFNNTPPVHALSRRGVVSNLRAFSIYGDYATDSPALEVMRALQRDEVDVAIVWGPFAGAVTREHPQAWSVTPVPEGEPGLQFRFPISVAVRKDAPELRAELDQAIERRSKDIDALVKKFAIPEVGGEP